MSYTPIIFCTFARESVRVCSRSAINALQRHTLHLQVREASLLSLRSALPLGLSKNRRLVSRKAAKLQTDNNRQFKRQYRLWQR